MNMQSLRRFALSLMPRSHLLYRSARAYADRYENENQPDIDKNGELWFLRQRLPRARVVFDVGANVGDWAELAVEINPAIELHCFEPSRATYQLLTSRGLPANVTCNNVGLGATRHDADLNVYGAGSGMNSLIRRSGLDDDADGTRQIDVGFAIAAPTSVERVRIETADEYCRDHGITDIDFCKIDVEGFEMDVFRGMTGLLDARRIQVIQFEYGGCNIDSRTLLLDLFRFFQPRGYTMHKLHPTSLQAAPRYDQRFENFQYQNWVAIASQ